MLNGKINFHKIYIRMKFQLAHFMDPIILLADPRQQIVT